MPRNFTHYKKIIHDTGFIFKILILERSEIIKNLIPRKSHSQVAWLLLNAVIDLFRHSLNGRIKLEMGMFFVVSK